ncbi:MAG: DUF3857 domain-containing protein, partial [Bacteroidota bacterium]
MKFAIPLTTKLVLLFFLCYENGFSQPEEYEFGKVTKSDLELSECDFYPEANAMILNQTGTMTMRYEGEQRSGGYNNVTGEEPQLVYRCEIKVRKKIFNEEGKDEGTVRIRLYSPVDSEYKEELISLKGATYNLEDGIIKREKLNRKEVFEKRLNEHFIELSFALPNLQSGSVIEYEYTISSSYIDNLRTIYLQDDIPIKQVSYTVRLPQQFHYQSSIQGNSLGLDDVDQTSNSKWFGSKDVPPVIDEPFSVNWRDQYSRVEFQLLWIQYPNRTRKEIAGDYQKLNDYLWSSKTFGEQIKNTNFVSSLVNEKDSERDKLKKVTDYIRRNIAWNEAYATFSNKAGRETLTKGEGSIADLNLTLVAGLREVGLEAYPVLLSTQGHGIPHPKYPNSDDFNYVIAAVMLNKEILLFDASVDYPPNILPTRCLNGRGWMVMPDGGRWVSLKDASTYEMSNMTSIEFEDGRVTATVKVQDKGYSALGTIQNLSRGTDEMKKYISEETDGWQLEEFNTPDKIEQITKVEYDFTLS